MDLGRKLLILIDSPFIYLSSVAAAAAAANTINLFGEVVARGSSKTVNDGPDSACSSTTIALFPWRQPCY